MTINSYFFNSVANDRPYSAADFAKAFGIFTKTGIIEKDETGALGFEVTGVNNNIVNAGKAVVEGHFIEVTGTETLTVPAGSYSGMIVVRVDKTDARIASVVVRTDQTPQQDAAIYEMPLYNCTVTNGLITAKTDLRVQGGAVAKMAASSVSWGADPNGIYVNLGLYGGTGKPVKLFLTSAQPAASSIEHRAWIQIDNF